MSQLLYKSTRNDKNLVTASQAILQGLAEDGGLYVPVKQPAITLDFDLLQHATYQEVAYEILAAYYTDFTEEELKACITNAYNEKFETPLIAPLKTVGSDSYLELFHGPTIAFKDLALSILPHLMTTAAKKNAVENELVILTATSGDTGKAAMEGFADVPHTKIIVFYPKDGVSKIQERQMRTQRGDNTYVVSVEGNFDDAQSKVKELFNDQQLRKELLSQNKQFSSANSINIGRLIPQVVYYVYTYAQLMKQDEIKNGEFINVTVPTGNFGNILAAHYAKAIGVPINKLICASNTNNVLTDFFATGTYDRNRPFFVTSSPSMDILISSNLERLLFEISGDNVQTLQQLMAALSDQGKYDILPEMREKLGEFYADFASFEQTNDAIAQEFDRHGYVLDPHTAVAKAVSDRYKEETGDQTKMVIVSTASPYKFPQVVAHALDDTATAESEFDWITLVFEQTNLSVPKAVSDLYRLPIRHEREVAIQSMRDCVKEILVID
ncbi:threonine synthase [Enterococcus italicus]|uniref:threonine synthase n=1 Tax=Enterococcus italicus TaxID=246144 RepID=UPI002072F69C|nr:threonine synthase [Enterococcus italicus]